MYLEIVHETKYEYTSAITPGLHYFHFQPQSRPYLRTHHFDLKVTPLPDGMGNGMDPENNMYHQAWFSSETRELELKALIRVETKEFNPFNFLVDELGPQALIEYKNQSNEYLRPYLFDADETQEIRDYVSRFDSGDPITLLNEMNITVAREWDHHQRMEQNIFLPAECFARRAGSCRDLSRMFMVMVRCKGFAARFVSGYAYVPGVEEGHELHAWVEVYLPGAGWIGFDPSLGLLATHQYIPVAASFEPSRTMPVQGFFRGTADTQLHTRVTILPADQP